MNEYIVMLLRSSFSLTSRWEGGLAVNRIKSPADTPT